MLFGGRSKQLVGLDIGSSSIKAVELKGTKAGYELISFGMEALAPDTVVDGAIILLENAVHHLACVQTRLGRTLTRDEKNSGCGYHWSFHQRHQTR